MPCSNARARILIKKGRAQVYRLFPFTIQLTETMFQRTRSLYLSSY